MRSSADDTIAALYRRYNAACNAHAFDLLAEFVHENVTIDGAERGLAGYRTGLEAVVGAFPDYRWDLRHLIVDDPWVAAHFAAGGTHRGTFLDVPATGRSVHTQEFAVYRFTDGRIAEVWGVADNLTLLRQLQGNSG